MDYESLAGIIIAPICIFLILVAPIWLIMHYRAKRQVSQGLTEDEFRQIRMLATQSEQMADRIETLEAILDAEAPDWRKRS
ncbi:envelope stress response membrane protein PspB [Echinimonas agarilytica]|uniref:Envelope stress response membrane protein PspB n=1 Tax=Echinimonas agarilytica TaxID=1215918 RepID=A0AA42B857_9GAMM|nr:envelope stress response membrane protein PspB [Echinimonas agarilytica]MCM2680018.1 envelope stress response membrane protein PspB [Echinimonas agarilytica]